jgi:hypothetical protein
MHHAQPLRDGVADVPMLDEVQQPGLHEILWDIPTTLQTLQRHGRNTATRGVLEEQHGMIMAALNRRFQSAGILQRMPRQSVLPLVVRRAVVAREPSLHQAHSETLPILSMIALYRDLSNRINNAKGGLVSRIRYGEPDERPEMGP